MSRALVTESGRLATSIAASVTIRNKLISARPRCPRARSARTSGVPLEHDPARAAGAPAGSCSALPGRPGLDAVDHAVSHFVPRQPPILSRTSARSRSSRLRPSRDPPRPAREQPDGAADRSHRDGRHSHVVELALLPRRRAAVAGVDPPDRNPLDLADPERRGPFRAVARGVPAGGVTRVSPPVVSPSVPAGGRHPWCPHRSCRPWCPHRSCHPCVPPPVVVTRGRPRRSCHPWSPHRSSHPWSPHRSSHPWSEGPS